MSMRDESFLRPYPNSIQEHVEHDHQIAMRAEAIRRHHSRMQAEMFGPPCPNCGSVGGRPVYGVDEDSSVGYSSDEERCSICVWGLD